jgi:small subunit ribosomal protein S24e
MDIEIDSKVNNALLKRTEVYFTIRHKAEGTPNREIIRSELAEKLNAKKENVIIKTIQSSFGVNVVTGYAKIYNSIEKLKEIEPDYMLIRNKIIKKVDKSEKKEDASAAPQKETVTTEERSEEETVEKKPETSVEVKEETKDEPKDKKQQSEEKSSDKASEDVNAETRSEEIKPIPKTEKNPEEEG